MQKYYTLILGRSDNPYVNNPIIIIGNMLVSYKSAAKVFALNSTQSYENAYLFFEVGLLTITSYIFVKHIFERTFMWFNDKYRVMHFE